MEKNQKHTQKNITDRVLEEIRSGQAKMTPRTYFVAQLIALAILALAIFFISIFIFNFIFFSIHLNSEDTLLHFGPRGFGAFLQIFPWGLLVADILFIVLLRYLLRKFHFSYRIPVLYFLGGLVGAALVAGFLLAATTSLNDQLNAHQGRLPPPLRDLYKGAQKPPPPESGMCRCEILTVDGNTLSARDTRNASTTFTVIVPLDNPHATTTGLSVGDIVFIAGHEKSGVIQAFGINKEQDAPPRPQ